jgi:hypothetical protein
LRTIVRNAIKSYFDYSLENRVRRARAEWREGAQETLNAAMDPPPSWPRRRRS